MQIKVHLSGCAIAFENRGGKFKGISVNSRPQGSLYSQQRRAVADAVEWMRLYGVNKPLFFVATSPGFIHEKDHFQKISRFTDNLRHNYGMRNYVWVRELTNNGYPHYHFIADIPFIRDPVGISRYWSGLFGSVASNSIRLGSAPINGVRKFYVDSAHAARYVSKYIGKTIDQEQQEKGKRYRTFAISKEARLLSQPDVFDCQMSFQEREAWNTKDQKVVVKQFISQAYVNYDGVEFNKHNYQWKRLEPHNVWFGFKKSSHEKQ